MFDRDQALRLLEGVVAGIAGALADLDTIRKEDGQINHLKKKRKAVRNALEEAGEQLVQLSELLLAKEVEEPVEAGPVLGADADTVPGADSAAEPEPDPDTDPVPDLDPDPDPEPDPVPDPEPEPEPKPIELPPPAPADLIPLTEQHAVSKLRQDTAVHLAARRTKGQWEIRHRNLPGGASSEPIRSSSIAGAYTVYEQQAKRPADFQPVEPLALDLAEQQALVDLWNIENDDARSVRWESGQTFVDYVLPNGDHGSSKTDGVTFGPGELIAPVAHLKAKLG